MGGYGFILHNHWAKYYDFKNIFTQFDDNIPPSDSLLSIEFLTLDEKRYGMNSTYVEEEHGYILKICDRNGLWKFSRKGKEPCEDYDVIFDNSCDYDVTTNTGWK